MDNDECGPTQLWELPDSECLNFHWVGYLAMELATGEIALSSKLLLFVLMGSFQDAQKCHISVSVPTVLSLYSCCPGS